MTQQFKQDHRIQQLITQSIDSQLSEEERRELNQLVQASSRGAELVVDHLLLDSLLTEELGAESMAAMVDMLVAPHDHDQLATAGEQASLESPAITPAASSRQQRLLRASSWFLAIAGVVLVMVILVANNNRSALANATETVEAALESHAESVQRVYAVELERSPSWGSGFMPPRDVRVTTQGDQFWVEMNGMRRWAWGRDSDGAIWMALGQRRGVRIEQDEVGPGLEDMAELYSLNLETLLKTVLRDFELEEMPSDGSTYVVVAVPRANQKAWMRQVTMVVDRETKAIRKLVMQRLVPRRGVSKLTFSLVDAGVPDETLYELEGHLNEDSQVMTRRSRFDRREQALKMWFGPRAEGWILEQGES